MVVVMHVTYSTVIDIVGKGMLDGCVAHNLYCEVSKLQPTGYINNPMV